MGYVGQEPVLYNQTIKENILFGANAPEKISEAEIQAALEAASAWKFVKKLKEGMHTILGTSGQTLSGG